MRQSTRAAPSPREPLQHRDHPAMVLVAWVGAAGAVYGIDLGTTYSCLAQVGPDGAPEVVPLLDGARTLPSVVLSSAPTTTSPASRPGSSPAPGQTRGHEIAG